MSAKDRKIVGVNLTAEQHRRLKAESAARDESVSKLVRRAVDAMLNRMDGQASRKADGA